MNSPKQILAGQIGELSQATRDHMGQIQTIFAAIGKIAGDDPVLAASLASVGAYLAELAEGDFDTIGLQLENVGKSMR